MRFSNPIIPGFFPDPSVCRVGDTFYLVCSSFQFFPGVPLFESKDLINWKQIGHVLTRKSQLPLEKSGNSGAIYAPTIRYNDGKFYMVTTNVSEGGNFYVWTDNIYGEWSEPIYVEQGGIDPTLYFEDGKSYFISNGEDDCGKPGIAMCEIDILSGKKLTASQFIYAGNGGRYLEAPHLYKIGKYYYIMVAEGGTEYGHMEVYARGTSKFGPFENYIGNPVLTNRNQTGAFIHGCGHGDLVEDTKGNWWMVHLAFRQIDQWMPFHITGREVYLVPVTFDENGWFTAGVNGMTPWEIETDRISDAVVQEKIPELTFENSEIGKEWCYLRNPDFENYDYGANEVALIGVEENLNTEFGKSPTALFTRQRQMQGQVSCDLILYKGEAGLTMYMDAQHHYEVCLKKEDDSYTLSACNTVGGIGVEPSKVVLHSREKKMNIELHITLRPKFYDFWVKLNDQTIPLASFQTRYLSSEVACGFTGVLIGIYAVDKESDSVRTAEFKNLSISYE